MAPIWVEVVGPGTTGIPESYEPPHACFDWMVGFVCRLTRKTAEPQPACFDWMVGPVPVLDCAP